MDTNHHGGQATPYGEPRRSSCKNVKIIKRTLFVNKFLLLLLLLLLLLNWCKQSSSEH